MFMTIGLLLLGMISFFLAFIWYRKLTVIDSFIEPLSERLGEPDTSGKKQYTNCDSHRWVMKNVVYGSYLEKSEGFRNFMMNRTMTGTLILSIFLGLIPVIIVYILFQSYQMIGTSLVLIILSVFVIRGPGQLEVSNLLLNWQVEQKVDSLKIGDLAYARISQKSIKNWIRNLILIGILTFIAAPWGEEIPIGLAYVFTVFLGFAYSNIFQPLAVISMPLALMVFFIIGPLILILAGLSLRSMRKKIIKDEGMIL
ncbi:MAG: hypothetical protein E4H14_02005 [Candidatus Thorarchaeota archaeon]|nr:MAG: hypothetical protein E4H14_02005 [Candidatus Thorarchaeota archaeon]